ncbi:MAG TPA: DNA recombination protein RmuC [Thermoanaerobaculia bacterium]|nr:DNA recombination protein RmuC [Thermoanaerobaculia bacterium]HUM30201.1 DNA recombination protein RmuC [Thermoanaerobaculia bacterium]HXK68350.1 DNA recombination protein RmuC [Thermoanaerobaculia bacterium]
MDPVTLILVVLLVLVLILQVAVLLRRGTSAGSADHVIRDEVSRIREDVERTARENREEQAGNLTRFQESLFGRFTESSTAQKSQLDTFTRQLTTLTESNERRMGEMRQTVETRIRELQESSEKRLDRMQKVVDETLQETLEKRIGESFKMVSDNLTRVQQGLGEMKALASSVGDLKKVLDNVKNRGTWGEFQLSHLLEQMLAPEQYATNVETKPGSNQRVEFAIRLPGHDPESQIWLPIDAKFPMERYQQLLEAYEAGEKSSIDAAMRELTQAVKIAAKDISEKYIDPPHTTHFAIMFLPIESLYADILRIPGLVETIQREYRVSPSGPTTLVALLNSLQMGFKTLAIEKRSGEVWNLLSSVKTEFGRFGEMVEKAQKSLKAAGGHLDRLSSKTRGITSRLKKVQELPAGEAEERPLDEEDEDLMPPEEPESEEEL